MYLMCIEVLLMMEKMTRHEDLLYGSQTRYGGRNILIWENIRVEVRIEIIRSAVQGFGPYETFQVGPTYQVKLDEGWVEMYSVHIEFDDESSVGKALMVGTTMGSFFVPALETQVVTHVETSVPEPTFGTRQAGHRVQEKLVMYDDQYRGRVIFVSHQWYARQLSWFL